MIASTASKSLSTIAGGNVALNIVLSQGLKYLWNMINLLQFVVFLQQWKFNLPSNAASFLAYLKNLALMEVVDTSKATKWISNKLGMCQECRLERELK